MLFNAQDAVTYYVGVTEEVSHRACVTTRGLASSSLGFVRLAPFRPHVSRAGNPFLGNLHRSVLFVKLSSSVTEP